METTLIDAAQTAWDKSKLVIKGLVIGFIALLLMIPTIYVKDLVTEREERQREVITEITNKWAGPQNIAGPIIGIPFWKSDGTDANGKQNRSKHIAYFLPETLNIDAELNPGEKHRGIFKVMLYDAKITMKGSFNGLAISKVNVAPEMFVWNEAFVQFNISDVKGLNEPLKITWNDSVLELTPQPGTGSAGMTTPLNAASINDLSNARFAVTININGSGELRFTPVGKSTTASMQSTWKDPSFSGSILPTGSNNVTDKGFKATWKSMSHQRNFPQQWLDNAYTIENNFPAQPPAEGSVRDTNNVGPATPASFGVNLFIPVNGYQKTLRTIKYALLCIVLTFAAFFLVETTQKKSVHPFQYGLVGLALVLFYTLLLSFSEYTGFDAAYLIAAAATVGLIAWFVRSVLQSGRATTILSLVLVMVYSYVFTLLQLQDYSLLFGSIGLFVALGIVMYFSRRLKW